MDEHTDNPQNEESVGQGDVSETEQQAIDELKGLRRLALRLVQPAIGNDTTPPPDATLLVGRMPSDFPFALPLPEDAELLGSIVNGPSTSILYDTRMPVEDLQAWYQQELSALGWSTPPMFPPHRGGFQHSSGTFSMNYQLFCQGTEGLSFAVKTHALLAGVVSVQCELTTYERPEESPCVQRIRHHHHDIFEMIPPLYPPRGATQQGGGGSGSDNEVYGGANLRTDLDLAAVVAHYHQQLVVDGWTERSSGMGQEAAWSMWQFQDNESHLWHGLFTALTHPDTPGQYFLVVRASMAMNVEGNVTSRSGTRLLGTQSHTTLSGYTAYGPSNQ